MRRGHEPAASGPAARSSTRRRGGRSAGRSASGPRCRRPCGPWPWPPRRAPVNGGARSTPVKAAICSIGGLRGGRRGPRSAAAGSGRSGPTASPPRRSTGPTATRSGSGRAAASRSAAPPSVRALVLVHEYATARGSRTTWSDPEVDAVQVLEHVAERRRLRGVDDQRRTGHLLRGAVDRGQRVGQGVEPAHQAITDDAGGEHPRQVPRPHHAGVLGDERGGVDRQAGCRRPSPRPDPTRGSAGAARRSRTADPR